MRYLPFLLLLLLAACTPPADPPAAATEQAELNEEDIDAKIQSLGIELPTLSQPVANYVHAVTAGKLVFLAGKGPTNPDGTPMSGRLGEDIDIEGGYAAARQVAIRQLAALKQEIGDLRRVKRIVKVLGMVNSTPEFTDQPKVVNGFSDLMVEVFGDRGKHARAAVGMAALPSNIIVEVEAVVELY